MLGAGNRQTRFYDVRHECSCIWETWSRTLFPSRTSRPELGLNPPSSARRRGFFPAPWLRRGRIGVPEELRVDLSVVGLGGHAAEADGDVRG